MIAEFSHRLSRTVGACLIGALVLGGSTLAVGAQDDDEASSLEDLREQREVIQEERAEQALKLDAATVSFDALVQALDDVNALVDLQEARLADANQQVRSAQAQAEAALVRQQEIAAEVAVLQEEVGALAVASFTGEASSRGDDSSVLLSSEPWITARRRSLIELQTGSLSDGVDRMRALGAEAEVVTAQRAGALEDANAASALAQSRQVELQASYDAQAELVSRAELRLEARLSEAAFLEEQDSAVAAEIRRQEEEIAARIRAEAARRAAIEAAEARAALPSVADIADITTVRGIQVHVSIAGAVEGMLAAAQADGVALSGWGYRDSIRQIELRQAHCGTSEYDIWEKPAFSCNPPTARPGQSLHERGLAIDFTYNGGSMTSRSNPGFQWLASNASQWGFVNLPSEPWHWSTTGQ